MRDDFATVVQLLASVPKPPGSTVTGASPDQLSGLQALYPVSLPYEVIRWLSVCNGAMAGPGGLYGAGLETPSLDIAARLQLHATWPENMWLPIAGDGNGNCYVVDLARKTPNGHAVFFVDVEEHSDELAYVVASDLERFLVFLLRSELGEKRWPFDAVYMLRADPAVADVPPHLLPWNA